MSVTVYHKPFDANRVWSIHVWDAAHVYPDTHGTMNGDFVEFQLPEVADPSALEFMYYAKPRNQTLARWERKDFHRVAPPGASQIWTFESTPRVVTYNPFPVGVSYKAGDVVTVHAITQSTFSGGLIFAWNAYSLGSEEAYFRETARDEVKQISTFEVTLQPWMTPGFNFKLKKPAGDAGHGRTHDVWEVDSVNRVWCPGDGNNVWIKSGQSSVSSWPVEPAMAPIEVMFPANQEMAPVLQLTDLCEESSTTYTSGLVMQYIGCPLFNVASYSLPYYPGAKYSLTAAEGVEDKSIKRSFPANPNAPGVMTQFAVGLSGWLVAGFPVFRPIALSIATKPGSAFAAGVSVKPSIGNSPAYQDVPAEQQPNGGWQAVPVVPLDTETWFDLVPAQGVEVRPDGKADTRRIFTPRPTTDEFHMAEGTFAVWC
jgi:hypothetical protein